MSLIAIAADYLLGKTIDTIGSQFQSRVIARWTKTRAEQFITTFCAEVVSGDEKAIKEQLDKILDDDQLSALLFDAYQAVASAPTSVL
jgi:hypothetical protein